MRVRLFSIHEYGHVIGYSATTRSTPHTSEYRIGDIRGNYDGVPACVDWFIREQIYVHLPNGAV